MMAQLISKSGVAQEVVVNASHTRGLAFKNNHNDNIGKKNAK